MKKHNLKIIAIVAAVLLSFGAMFTATAQIVDDDFVAIIAEVVGDMIVDANGQVIDLGQLPADVAFEVPADGSNANFDRAIFEITGPNSLNWELTVVWSDLAGPGDPIAILAPAGDDICFSADSAGSACTFLGSGGAVAPATHAGNGFAIVGYSVNVPATALPGNYANPEAIQLTAEALLN